MASSIRGMASLMAKLDKLGGNSQRALRYGVTATAEKARKDAQGMAPVDTTALRGSIRVKYEKNGLVGIVYTNNDHATYVEFGTGPVGAANHAGISPNVPVTYTKRPYWTYRLKKTGADGKPVYIRTSGQPARPYLYPAAVMNKDVFQREVEQALRDEIRRLGG